MDHALQYSVATAEAEAALAMTQEVRHRVSAAMWRNCCGEEVQLEESGQNGAGEDEGASSSDNSVRGGKRNQAERSRRRS